MTTRMLTARMLLQPPRLPWGKAAGSASASLFEARGMPGLVMRAAATATGRGKKAAAGGAAKGKKRAAGCE